MSAHSITEPAAGLSSCPPVMTGTLDEILDEFHRQRWTDGLPVVPPTRDRIEAFLAHTPRDPDERLGRLLPANVDATVWSVAVGGVMAGCRPEFMPLLLALVEIIADPEFRIPDAGSTPGWEPFITVSGPVVADLGFNTGTYALGVGPQANTSVGRFLKLYIRNVAGIKGPPDYTEKGSIGQSFFVALAENEDAVRQMGWQTYAVERGFEPDQSVVTVQSVIASSMPVYTAGERWTDHAELLADVIGQGSWAYWSWTALWFGMYNPLLVMSPNVASKIAADGASKDDLRNYFAEHVKLRAGDFERYAWDVGMTDFNLDRLVAQGKAPPEYGASSDPGRVLPALLQPERIGIVIAGDPDRNQSKGYVQNHVQGKPTSRVVAW